MELKTNPTNSQNKNQGETQALPQKISEINSLIDEFILSKPLKANSIRAYKSDLNFFVQYVVSERLHLESVTREKLLRWLKNYPARVSNRRGINIRRFLLWYAESKNFKIDPNLNLPWQFTDPQPQKPDKPAELSENEILQLLNSRKLDTVKRCILSLLLETGAALEELSALKWKNVRLGKLSYVTLGEYGKERIVALEEHSASLLKELQAELKDLQEKPEQVFVQKRSAEVISAAYMAIIIRRATNRILGREISPTELQELSKKKIFENNNAKVALEILGKKKMSTFIRPETKEVDIENLRRVHERAFA
ncbi:MAG: tyrosine-type recombinase/integrase [Candidatus Caenarcaniphilales bacterium]|nr:tyrosine-type recombinase/integrase [Candidatus Caenarcaniphilales bacterium]